MTAFCSLNVPNQLPDLFMDASVAQGVIDQCDAFLKTGDQNILFTTFDSRIASLDF